jgi:hypothetical protein
MLKTWTLVGVPCRLSICLVPQALSNVSMLQHINSTELGSAPSIVIKARVPAVGVSAEIS